MRSPHAGRQGIADGLDAPPHCVEFGRPHLIRRAVVKSNLRKPTPRTAVMSRNCGKHLGVTHKSRKDPGVGDPRLPPVSCPMPKPRSTAAPGEKAG